MRRPTAASSGWPFRIDGASIGERVAAVRCRPLPSSRPHQQLRQHRRDLIAVAVAARSEERRVRVATGRGDVAVAEIDPPSEMGIGGEWCRNGERCRTGEIDDQRSSGDVGHEHLTVVDGDAAGARARRTVAARDRSTAHRTLTITVGVGGDHDDRVGTNVGQHRQHAAGARSRVVPTPSPAATTAPARPVCRRRRRPARRRRRRVRAAPRTDASRRRPGGGARAMSSPESGTTRRLRTGPSRPSGAIDTRHHRRRLCELRAPRRRVPRPESRRRRPTLTANAASGARNVIGPGAGGAVVGTARVVGRDERDVERRRRRTPRPANVAAPARSPRPRPTTM